MAKKYLEKEDTIDSDILRDLECDLDTAITYFQNIPKKYPKYISFRLEVGGGWDVDELRLIGKRTETEDERTERLNRAKQKRESKKLLDQKHKENIKKEAIRLGLLKEKK